jgi:pantothenate synthetase
LQAVADAFGAGVTDPAVVAATGRAVVDAEPLARFEHLELVDPVSLQPVQRVVAGTVAVTAAWFDDIRLIDNRSLASAVTSVAT